MASIRGWNFPVGIDESTGKIKMVEDNENVKQGVRMILRTQIGERILRPYFGTNTNQYVFEMVTQNFLDSLASEVGESIDMWENNITDLSVTAEKSPKNDSLVKVNIEYMTRFSPEIDGLTEIMNQNEALY